MHNPSITTFNPLQPRAIRIIREVFDETTQEYEILHAPSAIRLPDDKRAQIARKLVELARHGELDVERLRSAARDEFVA